MKILHWKVDKDIEREAEHNYRTSFALNLRDVEPLKIMRDLTFDGISPDISIRDIEQLFDYVESNILKKNIRGVGLEVGSGPGTFSAILAKRKKVSLVYAVEICKPIVEILMPKMVAYVLGKDAEKVVGAIGSFDEIDLPEKSVDFIFDFFSLHHSNNLEVTLKECSRILKDNGFILCFDKARPNKYERQDLEDLLNLEYGEGYKKQFGLSPEVSISRRMNGEREYRLRDWEDALSIAGFGRVDYYYLAKTTGSFKYAKSILSLLPIWGQTFVSRLLPDRKAAHKFVLEKKNTIYSSCANFFPKNISVIIGYKG